MMSPAFEMRHIKDFACGVCSTGSSGYSVNGWNRMRMLALSATSLATASIRRLAGHAHYSVQEEERDGSVCDAK